MPKFLFFLGKGGVGKSTVSSLISVYLAKKNKKVVLTSLDPAHNLSDIFENQFCDTPKSVIDGLNIIEIDQDKWIKKYLKESEQQFSKSYSYLTTFSLEKHFSVMRYAPGVEEYALLLAFREIIKKNTNTDYLIFDMPPTALSLKFFALPQLSLLWLNKLMILRKEIAKKQEIISTLKIGSKSIERDRVMQNIEEQISFWESLNLLFKDSKKCFPFLVQNPDKLSQKEGELIVNKMSSLEMPPLKKVLNKSKSDKNESFVLEVPEEKNFLGKAEMIKSQSKINFESIMMVLKND